MSLFLITFFYFIACPAGYFLLFFLFPYFFNQSFPQASWQSLKSILLIIFITFASFMISAAILDEEISNRVLHVFAGGLNLFIICYLAARDSRVKITKIQFVFFSILVVNFFGVANEVAEFFGHNYLQLVFAPNINDTWLDLISNLFGSIVGVLVLSPFLNRFSLSRE